MLLLWILAICLFSFLLLLITDDSECTCMLRMSQLLWMVNMFLVLQSLISMLLLYSAPHAALNHTTAQTSAHQLLLCAKRQMPKLKQEWTSIDHCLSQSHLYNVSSGKLPYLRSSFQQNIVPLAFVFYNVDNESIFVTPEYQRLNIYDKALTLIHECAHLGLGAVDHAYRWQYEYLHLTEKEHYENADSFMDAVFYHCT